MLETRAQRGQESMQDSPCITGRAPRLPGCREESWAPRLPWWQLPHSTLSSPRETSEPAFCHGRQTSHEQPVCLRSRVMFLCWGDSDLGIAFSTHPGNQASSRQKAPARLGFPAALPLRSVVWMWFGSGGSKRAASRLERRAESLASPRDEA